MLSAAGRVVVEPFPRIAVNEEPRIAPVIDECDHPTRVVDAGSGRLRSTCLHCGWALTILEPRAEALDA